jgi:ribosomal protein S18 acetylase RimI-like enzyme
VNAGSGGGTAPRLDPLIRPLHPADLPSLTAGLAALPLLSRYGRTAASLAASLARARSRGEGLLVAEEGGAPAGLAWFLPSGTLALGGYLRLLAVLAPAQGRGVGAALLRAYEEATVQMSAHAFLLTSKENQAAQRFYERHGYRQVGLLPALVLPGQDELLYWKRLLG